MAKNREAEMPSINIMGSGTIVKGEINVNGDFRVDGSLIGQSADFSGEVQATVKVAELLTLKETARFSGDITTGKLAIEPGAKFSGTCMMEIPVKTDSKANGNEPSR